MISIETVREFFEERANKYYDKYYSNMQGEPKNSISRHNSKMPGRCWDLPAVLTCKGSFDEEGNLDSACAVCYASKNTFLFKNVKQPRLNNMLAWQKTDWCDEMVKELDKDRYFRFFASGDGYAVDLWLKIYEVVVRSPHCKFWIPTRMWKFTEFRPIIDRLNALPNCVVRFSGDSTTGQLIDETWSSTIVRKPFDVSAKVFICPSATQNGKCGECRECWSKNCQCVGYPIH